MQEMSVYDLARILNGLPVGQAIDVDPLITRLTHDWFTYGSGIGGLKRHLLQNLMGSAYGTFSVREKPDYTNGFHKLTFMRHEGGEAIMDRDGHALPEKAEAVRALGWPTD